MAVPISARCGRPRFGLKAGLVAAARGLAFTGLMLAGLGPLVVILATVGLVALGAGVLIVGNGGPRDQRLLARCARRRACLGRCCVPAALLGIRRLASLTRRLAGEWCGVPIAGPHCRHRRAAARSSASPSAQVAAVDPATGRGLLWMTVTWSRVILAAASAVIIGSA